MNAIISYIIKMSPYMLIAIPIYLIFRIIFLKTKKLGINWYHEAALLVFVIFIVGLASQTVIPQLEINENGIGIVQNRVHKTNLIPFKVLSETYTEVFVNGYVNYFIINFLGNIVMFLPFGLFIPLLWRASYKTAVLTGFCSSLFIETCQLFLARGTDVDDLLLNTLGAFVGVLIYKLLYRLCKPLTDKFKADKPA
ncbi:MAG: VanZ family protein [Ruminiclostridium sp.]|nr:VanZ family protein [Ruminiclostridium sp.]